MEGKKRSQTGPERHPRGLDRTEHVDPKGAADPKHGRDTQDRSQEDREEIRQQRKGGQQQQ